MLNLCDDQDMEQVVDQIRAMVMDRISDRVMVYAKYLYDVNLI